MKKLTLLSIIFILKCTIIHAQIDLNEYLNQITIENNKKHIDTLASESMEGRYAGEPGQKLAATYISQLYTMIIIHREIHLIN